jgi:GTP cyclohydrolase I
MEKIDLVKNVTKFRKNRVKELKKEFKIKQIRCFPNDIDYNGMVVVKDIEFDSLCEHHSVSITGKCHVGYIPGKMLIGLSQIGRIVEKYLNVTTMTIQEKATKQIADELEKLLKPQGLMVYMEARHACMSSRGVRQRNSKTVTSDIRGAFKNEETRNEFLWAIKR